MQTNLLHNPTTPTKFQLNLNSIKNPPTLRQGDWICFHCSNLNFAFRTICNRCKSQTRQTNFYNCIIPINLYSMTQEKSKGLMKQDINKQGNQRQWSTQNKTNGSNVSNKENKIFENALLLTPTKQDKEEKNKEYMDNDEPYRSPAIKLPSVSPLLKRYGNDVGNYSIERVFSFEDNEEGVFNNNTNKKKSEIQVQIFEEQQQMNSGQDKDEEVMQRFQRQIERILKNIHI